MATASNPRFSMQEDSIMSIGHFLPTQRNTHTRAKMMKQLANNCKHEFHVGSVIQVKGEENNT